VVSSSGHPVVLAAASVSHQLIDFFDYSTGEKRGTLRDLIAQPHELTPDSAARRLYLAHTYRDGPYDSGSEPGHEISVIDVDTMSVVDVIDIHPFIAPHDVEYNPATGLLLATVERNAAGNGVVVIDPRTRSVVDNIPTSPRNAHWLAVPESGSVCAVSHKEASMISVLDLTARKVAGEVDLPGGAEEVDISADGRWIFAATPHQTAPAPESHGPSRLVKIDAATLDVVGDIELPPANSAIRAGANGNVYVAQMTPVWGKFGASNGALHIVDSDSMSLTASVPLDIESFTVREAPDGATVCVANLGSGTISVIDLTDFRVVRTLECSRDRETPIGGTHGLSFVS
jgi:DNA-binding beta-propeller fold protein YncE